METAVPLAVSVPRIAYRLSWRMTASEGSTNHQMNARTARPKFLRPSNECVTADLSQENVLA